MTRTALLLSGVGRYADPWHPFAPTSEVIAAVAESRGFAVTIADDVDAAVAALEHGALPELLIANLGKPVDGMPSPAAPAGLERALAEVPLLAVHAAANSFPDSDAWAAAVGARWIDGVSWHPDYGPVRVSATAAGRGLGLADFDTVDERYHALRPAAERSVLLEVDAEGGGTEPVAWLVEGAPRRAYSALGHDAAAYDAEPVRELVGRLVEWVTA
ncbi:ThuA domain-containing protein [Salinibacterium soli]|uniref:ThuA domain-containing protein n=1 Tax=Antiquaquibacter soli TaxID=3064523 RepID=A0ABT9BSP6_9MICO|nr:ThuA domain-containing protein [Protaetiibacter sp. WY-16]MDO7882821.1 ThuA domain-containing protein [Protaetiibacter sp. WY-16]